MQFQTNSVHVLMDNCHEDEWANKLCYSSSSLLPSFPAYLLLSFLLCRLQCVHNFKQKDATLPLSLNLHDKNNDHALQIQWTPWCRLALLNVTSGISAVLQRPAVYRPPVVGAGHCGPIARRQALVLDTHGGVSPRRDGELLTESNNRTLVLKWGDAIKDSIN